MHALSGKSTPDIDACVEWLHLPLATLHWSSATAVLPLSISLRAVHSDQDVSQPNTFAQKRMPCPLPISQCIMLFAGACSPVKTIMLFAGACSPASSSHVWLKTVIR